MHLERIRKGEDDQFIYDICHVTICNAYDIRPNQWGLKGVSTGKRARDVTGKFVSASSGQTGAQIRLVR